MKRVVALVLVFGVTGTVLYFFFKQPENSPQESAVTAELAPGPFPPSVQSRVSGATTASAAVSAGAAVPAPSVNPPAIASATASAASPVAPGLPQAQEFTNFPPEIVLQKVAHAIHDYASMFGGNPVGTNPEITAALNGNNPRQANFISPEDGMRVNGNGELVDPWGTPFFFHQLSGSLTEIRSAGPDRKMWTSDDLVTQ
jgi:hypothetical protein